jgi:aspartyl-tRNA(Asn)/glutamyl-tRNA(Gln) amidotransferase subunit C
LSVTRDDVRHVALLARLSFDDEELERLTEEMNQILAYVDTLRELDTEQIEPFSGVTNGQNVLREDRAGTMLSPEEALKNAPDRKDNHLRVPGFLPDEPGFPSDE